MDWGDSTQLCLRCGLAGLGECRRTPSIIALSGSNCCSIAQREGVLGDAKPVVSGGDYGGRGVGDGGGAWVAMGRHPRRCHTSRRHPRAAALAAAVTTALLAPVALAD